MTDEDALLEAYEVLFAIANVSGGYVSRHQRRRIKALGEYIMPRIEARNGRVFLPEAPNG